MTGGDINQFLTSPDEGLTKKQRELKEKADSLKTVLDRRHDPMTEYSYKHAVKRAEEAGVTFPKPGSEEDHVQRVKTAFDNLTKAMIDGDMPLKTKVSYTSKDFEKAKYNFERNPGNFIRNLRDAGSLDRALDIIHSKNLNPKNKKEWTILTVAWYDKNPSGNTVLASSGDKGSLFRKNALDLDGGGGKPYYACKKEMAARAFSAFVDDKLRQGGRLNDYLAYATTNDFYDDPMFGPSYPYPEGDERERINAAFDELFKAVNGSNAIRKAISLENAGLMTHIGKKKLVFKMKRRTA